MTGVQLGELFHLPLTVVRFQVALPAKAVWAKDRQSSGMRSNDVRERRDCIPSVKAEKVAKGKTKRVTCDL